MPNILISEDSVTKLTSKEQIIDLNNTVRCKLFVSKIHGVGVVALRNIQKGERCHIRPNFNPKFYNLSFSNLNKLFPEVKALILDRWASVVNGSIFQSPNDDQHLLMFVNHSLEDYNYDVIKDIALRDIKEGEEILENYCFMDNAEKAHSPWLKCNKNLWPAATNVEKPKSPRNLIGVLLAKMSIKNFARS